MSVTHWSFIRYPVFPNPFCSYEVDNNRVLHIKRFFSDATYSLGKNGTEIEIGNTPDTWILNALTGSGHLKITGDAVGNSGITIKSLYGVHAFSKAVQGTHPELIAAAKRSSENEAFRNLTDADLEAFEISIPPLPEELNLFIYRTKYTGIGYPTCDFSDGSFVKEGDIISHYSSENDGVDSERLFSLRSFASGIFGRNTTNIVAPVTGKINYHKNIPSESYCSWDRATGKPIPNNTYTPSFARIRPLKGSNIEHFTARAYEPIINWLETVLSDSDRLDNYGDQRFASADKLRDAIAMLKDHPAQKIALKPPSEDFTADM